MISLSALPPAALHLELVLPAANRLPSPQLPAPAQPCAQSPSTARSQFPLARDGLDPCDVLAQAANLLQAFGLPHVELKLQLEQLVAQLVLLMAQLLGRQVAYFFGFHSQFSVRGGRFLMRTFAL